MISIIGNGFFNLKLTLVSIIICVLCPVANAQRAEKRVAFNDNKVSVVLPNGWRPSKKNTKTSLAGFETMTQRCSIFFTRTPSSSAGSMEDIMDGTVDGFDNAFIIRKTGTYKSGQVQGPNKKWPAIYVQLELEMKTNQDPIPFRFYIMLFDTGSSIYMIQASSMKPIRDMREKEILRMMKSVIAKS